jgi:hypothetical protein
MYKLVYKYGTKELINSVIRVLDNSWIPFDLANTDYQEYLKWLEEGNTPLPAEEVGLEPTADEISE